MEESPEHQFYQKWMFLTGGCEQSANNVSLFRRILSFYGWLITWDWISLFWWGSLYIAVANKVVVEWFSGDLSGSFLSAVSNQAAQSDLWPLTSHTPLPLTGYFLSSGPFPAKTLFACRAIGRFANFAKKKKKPKWTEFLKCDSAFRLPNRRSDPASRPHSWHSTKLVEVQQDADPATMETMSSAWHHGYHPR